MNATLKKNENQRRREVNRRLKRSEDVFMYQLARRKYAREYHYQSNIFFEELRSHLKVTTQPVIVIGKSGK